MVKLLWFRRNALVHQKTFTDPNLITHQAKTNFSDFIATNSSSPNSSISHQAVESNLIWVKPPCDLVKVNWDATYNQKEDKIGDGVIAWDHARQVLGTGNLAGNLAKMFLLLNILPSSRQCNSIQMLVSQELFQKVMLKWLLKKCKEQNQAGALVPF